MLSAGSALLGSTIGGLATFAASWLTQHRQLRIQALAEEARKRERLYTEFIAEAAKRHAEAWSVQAQNPQVLAELYGSLERMRLISSGPVVEAAEATVSFLIEAYAAPVRTFEDLRQAVQRDRIPDPLETFIAACRVELAGLNR